MFENNSVGYPAESPEHPMNFLLAEDISLEMPESGDIREGHVVSHRSKEILVDIGAKSEGIIAGSELDDMDEDTRAGLGCRQCCFSLCSLTEDQDGNIILSYAKAKEEEDWVSAQELLESQDVYKGKIVGCNRGGLLMMVGQVRGFIPASQLSKSQLSYNRELSNEDRLRQFVGEDIMAKVIEVDRSRNRLILSERAALKEKRAAERQSLLDELTEGDVKGGRIVNLADFGAFVDIGGIEGLVHLSELSWKRVNHPADILEVGQEVEVYVLNVDEERSRIALSLKRLEPDPWTIVDETYQEGDLVEATITKLARYGSFARLNDDYALEGLIHISELSEEHVEQPQDVVEQGQVVTVRIIRVDPEKRQLGLSLKQVSSDKFVEADLAIAGEVELE